jgi:radical SAM superfamily enzyme YgiQ (UPF0313 family)
MDKIKLDMLFIHPPARLSKSSHTLDADVGYTDQFVSFPVGFYSMGDQLDKAGFKVKIMNLGEMIYTKRQSIDYFLEELFARYDIQVVGIDIHWMIHSAGALATAKSVKKYSPLTKVVLGGISASYFVEEILEKFDFIDFVMVGECDGAIVDLVKELNMDIPVFNRVPNLAFRENGRIEKNPIKLPEIGESLVLHHYDLLMEKPVINPDRAIIPMTRGCTRNCCFCAGAKDSFGYIMKRKNPCSLRPSTIIRLIEKSCEMGRNKVYLYGDIRLNGPAYVEHFFRELNRSDVSNLHLVIELITLANEDFVRQWKNWVENTGNTLETTHSPESGNREVRKIIGKNYTNRQLVGLYASKFSYKDVRHEVVSFNLMQIPDAGFLLFRNPGTFGFKINFNNFETLVQKLTDSSHWSESVSFSTDKLSKQEIVQQYYYVQDTILGIYAKHRILPLQ